MQQLFWSYKKKCTGGAQFSNHEISVEKSVKRVESGGWVLYAKKYPNFYSNNKDLELLR